MATCLLKVELNRPGRNVARPKAEFARLGA